MLEVAFSESAAGSLKYAIGMKRGQVIGSGAVAVICDDPQERERILAEMQKPKVWQGGEIPGRPCDVVSLHLQLDFGDISTLEADPEARRAPLEQLYGHYDGVTDEFISTARQALVRILDAEELRLWIGEQDACDIAAAFWLCHLLRHKNVKMHAVYLPSMEQAGDVIRRYSGSGDMDPEKLSLYAEKAVEITPEMRCFMANRWCELREENAPVRAMLSGRIMGAEETIYDWILKREIPEGEFKLGLAIGRALGKIRAVGDAILYRRICAWVDEGILDIVVPSDDKNPYAAVLKRGAKWK